MTFSGSSQLDLDWSQVRETIKMLMVSVAQVEGSMKIGDESVNELVGSFSSIVEDMNALQDVLNTLEPGERRDNALRYCNATQERIYSSIVAFQFYDRLQQCLEHVSLGLKGLSGVIEVPERRYDPVAWQKLQQEIRSRYTMESEKIMFDAIHDGKSIEEALALVADYDHKACDDKVDIFF